VRNPVGSSTGPSGRLQGVGPKFTMIVTPLAKAVCCTLVPLHHGAGENHVAGHRPLLEALPAAAVQHREVAGPLRFQFLEPRPERLQLPPPHRPLFADARLAVHQDIEFLVLREQFHLHAGAGVLPR
jgi:hypothetical protein